MEWTEVPGSEDIKDIGTRKQLFFDDEIIETHRFVTPQAHKSAALLVETPAEIEGLYDAEAARGTDVSQGIPGHVIAATHNIRRTQHEPVRHPDNPIIRPDRPWEGPGEEYWRMSFPWVLHDREEGIWKMWYETEGGIGRTMPIKRGLENVSILTCYATSENGLHWHKPELGVVPFLGDGRTNIVFMEGGYHAGFDVRFLVPNVIKDPHDAEPGRWRYKTLLKTKPDQSVAVSPDGLHWEVIGSFPRLGDEWVGVLYDRENQVYVMFTRNLYRRPSYNVQGPSKRNVLPHVRTHRTYTMALSKDMLHWSHPRLVLAPDRNDSLDAEFEYLSPFRYEGMYVAILGVNRRTGPYVDASDSELVYSRDGLNWQRMSERRSFMSPGPPGSWDDVNAQGFHVVTHDEGIHVYYSAYWSGHPQLCETIGVATLRLDGFVSLEAPKQRLNAAMGMTGRTDAFGSVPEATLLTKPLWSKGNRLIVNAEAAGHITAELTEPDGRVITGFGHRDCDTFTGDSLRHTFSWRGRTDIGSLFPLRVRFRMIDARLYSLQAAKV